MTLEEIKDYLRRMVEETHDAAWLSTKDCKIILDAIDTKSHGAKIEKAEEIINRHEVACENHRSGNTINYNRAATILDKAEIDLLLARTTTSIASIKGCKSCGATTSDAWISVGNGSICSDCHDQICSVPTAPNNRSITMSLTEFCAEAAGAALANDDDRMARLYDRMRPSDNGAVKFMPMEEAREGEQILAVLCDRNAMVSGTIEGFTYIRGRELRFRTWNHSIMRTKDFKGWLPLPKVEAAHA